MRFKRITSFTALFLALLLFMQILNPLTAAAALKDTQEPTIQDQTMQESTGSDDTEIAESTEIDTTMIDEAEPDLPLTVEDGYILLYSFSQLLLIGSDQPVTDRDSDDRMIGTGNRVEDTDGSPFVYSLDASYRIAKDIPLPKHTVWQLPSDFTGVIAPADASGDRELYNQDNNTIYIYNRYQLATMSLDTADTEPVLSGDAKSATFGMGELIALDDEGSYLTYSGDHNYVISENFDSGAATASPSLRKRDTELAATGVANPTSDGRDFVGQVVKTIDGKKYILIGNEEQLRAIGTDAEVFSPVYEMDLSGTRYVVDTNNGTQGLLYGGDADLLQAHNGVKTYSFQAIDDTNSYTGHRRYYAGVDQTTGQVYTNGTNVTSDKNSLTQASWKTGEKYSIDSNYIIFRDIELGGQSDPWTPLMFNGTMYGAKSANGEALWNGSTITDSTAITATAVANRPIISGIYVNQNSPLIVNKYIGIGFFATISNKMVSNSGALVSAGTTTVKNLELHDVHVENNATTAEVDQTLISTVLSGVGTVVGALLDGLLTILSFGAMSTNTQDMLTNLLNARTQDPTIFATGAFAGRIYGDVLVEDCLVSGTVSVSNVKDRTGGFVGYTEGVARYSQLSNLLGTVVDGLATILNLVPAVGLGDLITILLGQEGALNVGSLLVRGYYNPKIIDCEVNGLTGDIGHTTGSGAAAKADTDFIGGFVGQQIGTQITDCRVKDSTYHVYAKNYGGGFSGLARDAEIKGTLDTGLGINLAETLLSLTPQSTLTDCAITDCSYQVTGGSCLGGFVGAMANSYAIDCTINCPNAPVSVSAAAEYDNNNKRVDGSGEYVGGFAGYMTAGWEAGLGKDETNDKNLVGTLTTVVKQLLQENPTVGQKLLTLQGATPSAAIGCQVYSQSLTLHADISCAGGFVGRGEGVYIAKSDQEAFDQLSAWNSPAVKTGQQIQNRPTVISYLDSVTVGVYDDSTGTYSGGDYAGGVAGYITSVAFQGLLNETLGLGNFLTFEVRDVTVNGVSAGYTVTTGHDEAGGGFGVASGGNITNVKLNQLQRVQANNRAAGFVAIAGPGDIAGSTGGLTVNLLGLNRLLSVKSLLSLGQLVEVNIVDSDVTGISAGYTVEAMGVGDRNNAAAESMKAAGYIADSNSTKIINSHARNLLSVTASATDGYAGGYIGTSATGGLAEVVGDKTTEVSSLIQANGLLSAIKYLIPEYTDCTVTYVDGGFVDADVAGGFVADFESGTVDNGVTRVNLTDKDDDDMLDGDWTVIDVTPWTRLTKEIYDPGNPNGDNTSGAVNPTGDINKQFAVFNIDHVSGRTYGGGFGGRLRSGALAKTGGGVSILSGFADLDINLKSLLDVVQAYVPIVKNAGVYSMGADNRGGFTVTANEVLANDSCSGSAGGFAGFMSGAQISHCDVYQLKHTEVTPPKDLEAVNAPSYFDNQSDYAVVGGHYAGGYVGNMDIGSAASLGKGLQVLGNSISLEDALKAFNVVVSTIEHSDVQGGPGGFSVIADGMIPDSSGQSSSDPGEETEEDPDETNIDPGATDPDASDPVDGRVGRSGGYAGAIYGGHIQNSHCKNFYYIIGIEEAGGYVGNMQPGNAANVLGDGSLLGKLINIDDSLASAVEDFVPTIRNSTTSCVPCGGAVRAQSPSDSGHQRGCAGGYCGHNEGGHIWGLNSNTWKDQNDGQVGSHNYGHNTEGNYTGEQHICTAWRIRSVYGYEYAGGFTGYMESADTADTGNISLLGGLVSLDNPVSALKMVYPTEEHTAVYGPLRNIDINTWNLWVQYVGSQGVYAKELAQLVQEGTVSTQADLNRIISKYIYGTHVVAGRSEHVVALITEGGDAGGYVGLMVTGTITDGQAYDTKMVCAMRSSGGYAGRLQTGAAASFGSANLLGLTLSLDTLLNVLKVFVPCVKSGSVHGYQSGLTVICTGTAESPGDSSGGETEGDPEESPGESVDDNSLYRCGYAGGYVGSAYGAQIWGDENADGYTGTGCSVTNLRYVRGVNAAGGFAGLSTAASVADVNTNASKGLLQGLLNALISSPGNLASVLKATASTMRDVSVSPDDAAYGFVVEGYKGTPPRFAGGFVGTMEATVINDRDHPYTATVNGLRSVDGQYYSGGFVGLADVGSVASVSDSDLSGQNSTTILGLINAGGIDVLDVFKTYIYDSDVHGVSEGFFVQAHSSGSEGLLSESRKSGCAGGFGGGVMLGVVERSNVTNLNTVSGVNYTGGFIGHAGKSGVVDADNATVGRLLGATAGVLDIFGTNVDDCDVTGIPEGYIVSSRGGADPIAGGYVGYADVSHILNSNATNLKTVLSDAIAGGFVGKTDRHYIVELEASSPLVQLILLIVNELVKALYVPELERADVLSIDIPGLNRLLSLKLLSDGDLLYVNLLGLRIGVSLVQSTEPGTTDTALVTIGDSSVALPCSSSGIDLNNQNAEAVVKLIKGNRSKCDNCTITGVPYGYDVFGGGSGNLADATSENGMAGGFVGYNIEGKFIDNTMVYCDVVKGTPHKVGPFSGVTTLQSVYSFNDLQSIEQVSGKENQYSVYRVADPTLAYALTSNHVQIGSAAVQDTATGITYNRYDVVHLAPPLSPDGEANDYHTGYDKWEGAVMATDASGAGSVPIEVYETDAKVVLMRDTYNFPRDPSITASPGETQDPCEYIKIIIQKVWDDWNDHDGIRPASLQFRITQHQVDANGDPILDEDQQPITSYPGADLIPDIDPNGCITLTAANDGVAGTAIWERVIEGLPVQTAGPNDEVIWYKYTVEEVSVPAGYGLTTEVSQDGFTFKFTNTHRPTLPITGSFGDWMLILMGVGIVVFGVVIFKKKKTSSKLSANLTFRPPRGQPRGHPRGDPTGLSQGYTRGSPRGHPRGSPTESLIQTRLLNSSNILFKKGSITMTKRLFAIIMAVAILFAMAIPAFAETNKADLTVSGENLAGKDVTVVNIFSDTSQTTDTNPNYVLRDAWKPFFADELGIQSNDPDISTKAYRYVVAMQDDSADLIALAEAAREYYVEQKATNPTYFITETHQEADANDTATFTDLNAGMYLVLPEGGSTSADRGTDAMIVTIRNTDIDMDMKSVYPKVEKGVKPATAASNAPFTDDTSASVGDYVQFQLVSTVPEMSDYTTYTFKFKDTLSNGLTLDKTNAHPMTLTIGSVTLVENTDYTFAQNGQSFVVAITDLKGLEADTTKEISVGDSITLTYFAELNANAVIGTAGNANSATVEYSNDPSTAASTDESNPDVSKVYTYEIEINKFSRDGADEVALSGAKFEIYNTAANTANRAPIQLIATAANTYRVATPQEIADTTVTKVTEVTTPSDGKIKIDGLNLDTTYYLKETEAPTGYNQLTSEVTVVISTDNSATAGTTENNYASVYYTVNGTQNANANDNKVKIENRPGSMLPTTGSIGTIGLTIAGVALVIFGILFTSRKKKSKKAE